MDFEPDAEQRLLQDSLAKIFAERYTFAERRAYAAQSPGWSRARWSDYADMGVLGLALEAGASRDGHFVHLMSMMAAYGRALALEPYLASVVLCGSLLRRVGNGRQRQALLPAIANGKLLMAMAHSEEGLADCAQFATIARPDGNGWRLDGRKIVVQDGDTADQLVVVARVQDARAASSGVGAFIVDANAPGIHRHGYAMPDAHRAADIDMVDVRVPAEGVLGRPGDLGAAVDAAIDLGIVALAAEAVGCMDSLVAMSVEYLNTRVQFGATLGTFQALRHRAADMLVALEQARSIVMFATLNADAADARVRARAAAAAKILCGRSAREVGQSAVQLHGGMGLADEHAVGHYLKRLTSIDLLLGDADCHLRRLTAMGGLFESAEPR